MPQVTRQTNRRTTRKTKSDEAPSSFPGPVRDGPVITRRKPVKSAGAPSGPARARKRATAYKKLSPRAKQWRRFYTGLRRDLERYQPLFLFAALSLGLLAVYGVWSSGVLSRTGQQMGEVGGSMLSAGGLDVDSVTIQGRTHVSESEVLKALGAYDGDSLLKFDVAAARTRVEALPWVKTASVARLFPNRLHITVAERTPYAIWQQDGSFALIDRDGHRLESLSSDTIEPFSYLPHVVGEGANDHAAALLDLLEDAPALRSRLRAASRVGNRRWNLALDNGITVRLPDTELAKAIQDIIDLDSQHRLLARRISVIDLRLPDVLIVRPIGNEGTLAAPKIPGGRRVVVEDREA